MKDTIIRLIISVFFLLLKGKCGMRGNVVTTCLFTPFEPVNCTWLYIHYM